MYEQIQIPYAYWPTYVDVSVIYEFSGSKQTITGLEYPQ